MGETMETVTEVCRQAALLKNRAAWRFIVAWLEINSRQLPEEWTAKAMWAEMKAHRRYLRSVGAYPVKPR